VDAADPDAAPDPNCAGRARSGPGVVERPAAELPERRRLPVRPRSRGARLGVAPGARRPSARAPAPGHDAGGRDPRDQAVAATTPRPTARPARTPRSAPRAWSASMASASPCRTARPRRTCCPASECRQGVCSPAACTHRGRRLRGPQRVAGRPVPAAPLRRRGRLPPGRGRGRWYCHPGPPGGRCVSNQVCFADSMSARPWTAPRARPVRSSSRRTPATSAARPARWTRPPASASPPRP
jgi:hypothetical protein